MMKLTFLGSGSAFVAGPDNYHSNLLLENEEGSTLLIDCGSDARRALRALGKSGSDIGSVFITHLHGDHVGGLEWLAMHDFLNPEHRKPALYISEELLSDLWHKTLSGGLLTLKDKRATLDTFFEVHPIHQEHRFIWKGTTLQQVQAVHFYSNHVLMPTFGLFFNLNGKKVYFTADTQFCEERLFPWYAKADLIFQDCETAKKKSGVHARYEDLAQLPVEIREKMWLYHYNEGTLPDATGDGFLGFVKRGQSFE